MIQPFGVRWPGTALFGPGISHLTNLDLTAYNRGVGRPLVKAATNISS